jgi:hypothetical protein
MAIFSRRLLQHLVNDNAKFLKPRDTKKIVSHLNRMHKELTLAPEWEVVIINALSKIGTVQYEQNFGGTRNPDISFTPFSQPQQSVAVEITTLSDKGLDAKNPIEELHSQVIDRVAARGLRLNGFHFKVEGIEGHKYRRYHRLLTRTGQLSKPFFEGGKKTELKLPGPARFAEKIFNAQFNTFLDEIENAPVADRDFVVKNPTEKIDVTISYRPREPYSLINHPGYKQIAHISENQIYEALEDKADQLVDSNFSDRLGIILCDGDYSPFHHDRTSVDEVIKLFLENRTEINFVLTLKIKRKWRQETIEAKLYRGQYFDLVGSELVHSLHRMVELLPTSECDTCNAFHHLKSGYPQEGNQIGMATTYTTDTIEVRIPTRKLMELLAGRLSYSTFSKLQGYEEWEGHPKLGENPFALCLQKGWMISNMNFESHAPDEDNDFIVLTFDTRPDAAIHPFIAPPAPRRKRTKSE